VNVATDAEAAMLTAAKEAVGDQAAARRMLDLPVAVKEADAVTVSVAPAGGV
jgi:hypothetical protein